MDTLGPPSPVEIGNTREAAHHVALPTRFEIDTPDLLIKRGEHLFKRSPRHCPIQVWKLSLLPLHAVRIDHNVHETSRRSLCHCLISHHFLGLRINRKVCLEIPWTVGMMTHAVVEKSLERIFRPHRLANPLQKIPVNGDLLVFHLHGDMALRLSDFGTGNLWKKVLSAHPLPQPIDRLRILHHIPQCATAFPNTSRSDNAPPSDIRADPSHRSSHPSHCPVL